MLANIAKRSLFASLLAIAMAGCATAPPVQEMSDARQAIAAAREAGAEQRVPAMLQEAESHLSSAEDYLSRGDNSPNWSFARREARAAKEIALDALLRSREAGEPKGSTSQ
ncbi:MAG: DUF4398 domain-containing protein [Chromatiales bacterium]|nr:MAG: DUF4398 domain-containing protein [Chromatiales bacterium]